MKLFKKNKIFRVDFIPKEDITTFELAQCLKIYAFFIGTRRFLDGESYYSYFESYPDNIKNILKQI